VRVKSPYIKRIAIAAIKTTNKATIKLPRYFRIPLLLFLNRKMNNAHVQKIIRR